MTTTDRVSEVPPPRLEMNGTDCWITVFKHEPTLPLKIGVDKTFLTDSHTLVDLYFKAFPRKDDDK